MFDNIVYGLARDRVAAVIDPTRRIPDVVFRGEHAATTFCEVEAVFGANLWPAFAELAAAHGDERVYLLVVEPDADDYVASYSVVSVGFGEAFMSNYAS